MQTNSGLIFACFWSLLIDAQDLIYKKNSPEILAAKIVNTLAKSINYRLPGETDQTIHHLSVDALTASFTKMARHIFS